MNVAQQNALSSLQEEDEGVNLAEYYDILLDARWLILSVAIASLVIGAIYAVLARPIYESNLTIQVEDSDQSAGSFLGDAASTLFSIKTPAAGEIEILRSRMVLSQAVENTKLYISARPLYIPVIGPWLSRRSTELSEPGFLWLTGYVSGAEKITVPQFEVPASLEGSTFKLIAKSEKSFTLTNSELAEPIEGAVGQLINVNTSKGRLILLVSALSGRPGANYELVSNSKQRVLSNLQDSLRVVEKGKQSGVLDITWQNADPRKLAALLNEIGALYVRQNVDRKAAQAEKTLGFLDKELPNFKRQLEQSEDAYNRYRNQNGTISLDDEAKNALTQVVDLQSKLIDAQQKRRELAARFTDKHPSVQTLDSQIAALSTEVNGVDSRIRKMPMLQQNALRMQRDIKVNTDLYVSMLNSSLQMRLAKEGKVGNVRLLDEPIVPEDPVRPQKTLILALSLLIGLFLGAVISVAKSMFFGGIRSPYEIEASTGLTVYSTIPLSDPQLSLDKEIKSRHVGTHVLVSKFPDDAAVESLRSLRTALQFAMLDAPNNRVLISGGTPGVGKSFVSVNFAAVVAASGKRVLLIDADLRKGHINQFFGISRLSGLSELIVGSKDLNEVIKRGLLPNLDLMTTGVLPPNPAELLMSESFAKTLAEISPMYDLVVIDTAPVLVASDTASVATLAGTLLLVARAGLTNLGEINESVKRLAHVGATVNGAILNAMDMTRRHNGSYGYKYGVYRYTQYKYEQIKD